MKLDIEIKKDNVIYQFGFLNHGSYDRIYFDNEFIIDLFKYHNHSYSFKAFFYKTQCIYSYSYYRTKKELYCAVQNLLKQELYHVLQFKFNT